MSTPEQAEALSPELRATFFHFSVFLTHGVGAVCFAIWLSGKNIPPEQIGIINAVPLVLLLGMNVYFGRLADRANDWKDALVLMSLVGGLIPIGLFFVDEFWSIVVVWSLCALVAGSVPPVIDAATIRMTQRRGTDFGMVRAWGTVGYMSASVVAGVMAGWYGAAIFVPLYFACALLRAGLSLQLPRFRAPGYVRSTTKTVPHGGRLRTVMRPWFVLPLIAFALVQVAHAILAIFAALVWKEQGISEGVIGPLIAVGAAAEALMMFLWTRLGVRLSARQMILLACVVTALRWTAMAFEPPVPVLFALQLTHAITYAIGYFGTVQFIAKWTSEDIAAEAQGFSFVLAQATTIIGILAFGSLAEALGARAFILPAVFGLLGAICVLVSLRLRPTQNTGDSLA